MAVNPYQAPLGDEKSGSRFQFTLRSMFWATFWGALGAAAWGQLIVTAPTTRQPELTKFILALVGLIAPWGIIGALHQEMKNAMLTGLVVFGGIALAFAGLLGLFTWLV